MRTQVILPTGERLSQRWSLSKMVQAYIQEQRVIEYDAAPAIELQHGTVRGVLRLARYAAPSEEQPENLVSITFDFLDEAGRPWRYLGLLYAWLFWPPANVVATVTPRRGPGDLMMSTLLDGRDNASLRIHTGERITVRLKYFSFDLAMSPGPDPEAIRVHAIMCPVNDHPMAPGDHLHVEYDLPVIDFLWRRASFVLDEDVDVDSGDFIDLRPLESIDPSIPRSPIRVFGARSP